MKKGFFVTGIGTGVGKTFASAVLCEATGFDYWKPVQAGDLHQSDTITVKSLVSRNDIVFHPERYQLQRPASPHWSAAEEGIEIKLSDFDLPQTERPILVEGAGGLMVPLNNRGDLMADLISQLGLPVIVVSSYYLGSINHTLLTINELKRRGVAIQSLLINGDPVLTTREAITVQFPDLQIIEFGQADLVNKDSIKKIASRIPIDLLLP